MPALAAAREQARATSCSGNLKQFGVMLQFYSNDYKDVACPMRYTQRWSGIVWSRMLWNGQYLRAFKLLRCPSQGTFSTVVTDFQNPVDNDFYQGTSYGLNGDTFGGGFQDTNYWGGNIGNGIKLGAIATWKGRSPHLVWVHDSSIGIGGCADMGTYIRFRHKGTKLCNILAFGGHVTSIKNPRPGMEAGAASMIDKTLYRSPAWISSRTFINP